MAGLITGLYFDDGLVCTLELAPDTLTFHNPIAASRGNNTTIASSLSEEGIEMSGFRSMSNNYVDGSAGARGVAGQGTTYAAIPDSMVPRRSISIPLPPIPESM